MKSEPGGDGVTDLATKSGADGTLPDDEAAEEVVETEPEGTDDEVLDDAEAGAAEDSSTDADDAEGTDQPRR